MIVKEKTDIRSEPGSIQQETEYDWDIKKVSPKTRKMSFDTFDAAYKFNGNIISITKIMNNCVCNVHGKVCTVSKINYKI